MAEENHENLENNDWIGEVEAFETIHVTVSGKASWSIYRKKINIDNSNTIW